MTKKIAYYIDDEQSEAKRTVERLNKDSSDLEIRHLPPPQKFSEAAIDSDAQIFFVDWELDSKEDLAENTSPADYKGGTFAQWLREQHEDRPIVLVTRDDLLDERARHRYVQEQRIFDLFISKGEMKSDPAGFVHKAHVLIDGFAQLRESPKTWDGFLSVLGAEPDEGISVGEAAVPMVKDASNAWTWMVLDIAKWVHTVLLEFPGLLYNSLHAATLFGISEATFKSDKVQSVVARARYQGIFDPPEGRWWKSRLLSIGYELLAHGEMSGDIHSGFAAALEKIHGIQTEPAQCVFSGETPADRVCHILQEPVKLAYSLLYNPDARPSIMDPARVSFKAIRESNDAFLQFFPPSSQDLVEQIMKGGDV